MKTKRLSAEVAHADECLGKKKNWKPVLLVTGMILHAVIAAEAVKFRLQKLFTWIAINVVEKELYLLKSIRKLSAIRAMAQVI